MKCIIIIVIVIIIIIIIYLFIKLSFACQPEKFPWSGLELVTRAIHQG